MRDVADEACRRVLERVEDLASYTGVRVVHDLGSIRDSRLWWVIAGLTKWAQVGGRLSNPQAILDRACDALYNGSSPSKVSDAISCVVLAAKARIVLVYGRGNTWVSAAELACLTNLSATRIHQLQSDRHLKFAPRKGIHRSSARAFALDRGVVGLGQ